MTFAPDVPNELQRIVDKALRKDREQRYQLMKEMWLDLQALRDSQRRRREAPLSSEEKAVYRRRPLRSRTYGS